MRLNALKTYYILFDFPREKQQLLSEFFILTLVDCKTLNGAIKSELLHFFQEKVNEINKLSMYCSRNQLLMCMEDMLPEWPQNALINTLHFWTVLTAEYLCE